MYPAFPSWRWLRALVLLALWPAALRAQYNVDRLITSGEVALHYEDYVLSIQYFSKAIALKPYLWQPWYDRAVAKYYLEDFIGAEQDATQAIALNPYIEDLMDLRALARIKQEKWNDAVEDYTRAIRLKPTQPNYWLNRAYARLNLKDYDRVSAEADTITQRWAKMASGYSIKAEVELQRADTTKADYWLARTLEVDPYNANAWTTRAYIALNRKMWKRADSCLTRAIALAPRNVSNYVNRALTRIRTNQLRGAMEDYDMAIELDPNNFLAHYNRGLLRVQLGDDNRAITDFDFVIRMEPHNVMAIYNRALLNDKVGHLREAIRDYTLVINQFPNFWAGLAARARVYRRLGQTAKAEQDEFRIFKAQMDKHIGIQPRWSRAKLEAVRKRSEVDPTKYNDIVVEDKPEVARQEYKSEYRGAVQNREVDITLLPMFSLSYFPTTESITQNTAYDEAVENFNRTQQPLRKILLTCNTEGHKANDEQSRKVFQLIDALSAGLQEENDPKVRATLLLQRAVAYAEAQNYADALADLNDYVASNPNDVLGYWQRAVCQSLLNDFEASRGQNVRMMAAQAEGDFAEAIKRAPKNAYLYFDRGNLYVQQGNTDRALADYDRAIQMDPRMAEAFYNRGLTRINAGKREAGLQDLSKAGELGLYAAYSLIKQHSATTAKSKK